MIIDVSQNETVKLKSMKEKVRKYVTIVDDTCYSVTVTLWGDIIDKFPMNPGDLLAISGARISDFGGKSLNAASDHADVAVNPVHEKARKLSYWYNNWI